MPHTPPTRECARGTHCAGTTTTPEGRRVPAPALVGACCSLCETTIRTALGALPRLYAELRQLLHPTAATADEPRVSLTRTDAPIPINTHVEAVAAEVERVLLEWEDRVLLALDLPPVPAVSWGARPRRLVHAAHTLADHLGVLLMLPAARMRGPGGEADRDGADAVRELVEAHRRAERAVRPVRAVYVVPGVECPAGCGARALTRREGEESASCPKCGAVVPAEEYRRLLTEQVA